MDTQLNTNQNLPFVPLVKSELTGKPRTEGATANYHKIRVFPSSSKRVLTTVQDMGMCPETRAYKRRRIRQLPENLTDLVTRSGRIYSRGELSRSMALAVLEKAGIDVDRLNEPHQSLDKWLPLHWAVHGGKESMVKALMVLNANVDVMYCGKTPLHRAVTKSCLHKGYNGITRILLEAGADPERQDNHYNTALGVALGVVNLPMIRLLVRSGKINVDKPFKDRGAEYPSPLQFLANAALNKCNKKSAQNIISAAREIISAGANINLSDSDGNTFLLNLLAWCEESACAVGMIELLIEKGASFDKCNADNLSAIEMAVMNHPPVVVKMLIQAGADLRRECKQLVTPLIGAICLQHPEIVEILLHGQVDFNQAIGAYNDKSQREVIKGMLDRENLNDKQLEIKRLLKSYMSMTLKARCYRKILQCIGGPDNWEKLRLPDELKTF